jgi:hypothetical protein
MKQSLPQEIEIWYVIPALRRELAKVFIKDFKLSQKEAAQILKVTEAAISHYFSSKRGSDIKFSKEEKNEIKKVASKILEDKKNSMRYIYGLSVKFRRPEILCKIHKRKDRTIDPKCDMCFR